MNYRSLVALVSMIVLIVVFSPLHRADAVATALAKPPNNLGLIGYWSFNEATSTKAGDFSGTGNDASFTGSPVWVAGRRGAALKFDAASTYAQTASNIGITGAAARTVTFWTKLSSTADQTLVSLGTATANGLFAALYYQGSWFLNGFNAGNDYSTGVSAVAGTWYFNAITYDGTTAHWYLNGSEIGPGYAHAYATADGPLRIGARIDGTIYSDATVDDVRVYSRALSATEVAALYARGTAGAARMNASSKTLQQGTSLGTGLSGFWTLDGADVIWTSATAGTARDSSGNGRSLTVNSMNRGTSVTPGKLGQGLLFNGSSSSLSTSLNLSSFITASNATIAVWVKPTGTPSATQMVITDDVFEDVTIVRDNASTFSVNNWDGAAYDTVSIPYTNNEWIHIVLVHTGGTLYAYKNGSIVGSVASGNTTNLADPLIVGASNATAYFNGSMDEIRTYTRGLSAPEVKQLYLLGAMKIRP